MGLAVTTEHSKLSNTRPIGMAADCCINSSVAPSVGLHAIFWWNCRCSTTRVSNEAPPRRPHHPVRHSSHSVAEEIADRIPQCVLGCYIGMYVDTYQIRPSFRSKLGEFQFYSFFARNVPLLFFVVVVALLWLQWRWQLNAYFRLHVQCNLLGTAKIIISNGHW